MSIADFIHVTEVEQGLRNRMSSALSQHFQNAGGVQAVAEILNVTDRATERALLESLAQEDPELVEEIRRLMFVFDDLGKLTDKDIQTVLKNVETSQWAMALKGSSAELKQKIDAGQLGKKSGHGFYTWSNGKAQKPARSDDANLDALARDLMVPYLLTCRDVLEEGLVADADLLDAGMIFGTGFPPHLGGPLHYLSNHPELSQHPELIPKPSSTKSPSASSEGAAHE